MSYILYMLYINIYKVDNFLMGQKSLQSIRFYVYILVDQWIDSYLFILVYRLLMDLNGLIFKCYFEY